SLRVTCLSSRPSTRPLGALAGALGASPVSFDVLRRLSRLSPIDSAAAAPRAPDGPRARRSLRSLHQPAGRRLAARLLRERRNDLRSLDALAGAVAARQRSASHPVRSPWTRRIVGAVQPGRRDDPR